jgi:hypothetical protein
MSAREGHNLLIIEAHAPKDVTQALSCSHWIALISSWQAAISCYCCSFIQSVCAASSPLDLRAQATVVAAAVAVVSISSSK